MLWMKQNDNLSLEVWDLKLTNPKLGDRPWLWHLLPPGMLVPFEIKLNGEVNFYFKIKLSHSLILFKST